MSTPDAYAPFRFMEYKHQPGLFGLLLTDDKMFAVEAIFEKAGRTNNGHTWGAIAEHLMKHEAPKIGGVIKLDCEAGMFAARSTDSAALGRLAALLRDAFHDGSRLAALLAIAGLTQHRP